MFNWLISNLGTILISLLLFAIVIFLIWKLWSDTRKGKSYCGCNCTQCAMGGSCHKK